MKRIISIVTAAALTAAITVSLAACGEAKVVDIELNDYVSIEFEGTDGAGTAQWSFDDDAFIKEYGNVIKYKDTKTEEDTSAADALLSAVKENAAIDPEDGLANGDTIHFMWYMDKEAIEETYNVSLFYSDFEAEVEGLEDPYVQIVSIGSNYDGETLYTNAGENILFTAQIDTNTNIDGKVVLHVNDHADETYTMYDSGTFGDETAGDGIYSITIRNNIMYPEVRTYYVTVDDLQSDGAVTITYENEPEPEPEAEEGPAAVTDEVVTNTPDASSPEITVSDVPTAGETNAVNKAKDHLEATAFSRSGLIDQLEYEDFSEEEAEYGADHCGADWNEQAIACAKDYLETMAFSYTGLTDQLEYEGFTSDQAAYGVDNCGADWNEQAARKAQSYLKIHEFTHDGLAAQLEFEGFTAEQAEYGTTQAGL